MTCAVLATKLYFPPAQPNLVPRPRLLARLAAGLRSPLTLISSPAGYGKTTLLAEWRAGPGRDVPAGWLTLDAGDNDLARLVAGLAAALDPLQPGLSAQLDALLHAGRLPAPEALLAPLVNALNGLPRDVVLALDELHLLDAPAAQAALAFLVEHRPAHLHLALLTRSDPPLPLARLRARGELVEIRAAHLRFDEDEAALLLRGALERPLDPADLATLVQRTEGWPAGLQLAALSMQGRDPAELSAFVAAFGGSHHYVVDYLAEEVLNRLPAATREFLLRTSILERLCGPLCDAVSGQSGGQATLERLQQENVFLSPLDDERRWFRYHRLFSDVLRDRLGREVSEDELSALHGRAGSWHERAGDADAAIEHALTARDWPRALALMDAASVEAHRRLEIGKLLGWVHALPASVAIDRPNLCIYFAWAVALSGRFEQADKVLAQMEPGLLAMAAPPPPGRPPVQRLLELAQCALSLAGDDPTEARRELLAGLALACWHSGRIAASAEVMAASIRLAEQREEYLDRAIVTGLLALAQMALGRLNRAAELCHQAIDPAVPGLLPWHATGLDQLGLALLHYEWDELDEAQARLDRALEYCRTAGRPSTEMSCHLLQALLCQARGDAVGARATLAEGAAVVERGQLPAVFAGRLAAGGARVALLAGDVEAAATWLARVRVPAGGAIPYPTLAVEPAMLALARGDRPEAAARLAALHAEAAGENVVYARIEIRCLQALAAEDPEQGLRFLGEALTLGAPERFTRVFLDRGPTLAPLLREAVRRGIAREQAARLLAAWAGELPPERPARPPGELVTPLSERELEVLQLVAAGLSNSQIAAELVLATGTVKRHLSNIFVKLDAESRTHCVARAHELGLL